jgi:hypothetical protein
MNGLFCQLEWACFSRFKFLEGILREYRSDVEFLASISAKHHNSRTMSKQRRKQDSPIASLLLISLLFWPLIYPISCFQIRLQKRPTSCRNSFQTARYTATTTRWKAAEGDSSSYAIDETLFTEETCALIAREVQKHVTLSVPIPSLIIDCILNQIIDKLTKDLSNDLLLQLRAILEAESTITEYDDVDLSNIHTLAHDIAVELNGKMDAPLLNDAQELEVLEGMMNVILTILTTSEAEEKELRIQSSLNTTRSLLGNDESRRKLANMINDAVDVPVLNEQDERIMLLSAVNSCADALQRLLPPELVASLQGNMTTAAGLAELKLHLVKRLCTLVDLSPFMPRQHEEILAKKSWRRNLSMSS